MARLPRLALGGEVHLLLHRGHNGQPIVADDADRTALLRILNEVRTREGVAIHAYVLLDDRLWLLATPKAATALGRMMQALGRRHTAAFNARHGRSGTLWDGRYRSAIVEPGAAALEAMLFVERAPVVDRPGMAPSAYRWSSAAHHVGAARDPLVTDVKAYWDLGNTPFEREHRYALLIQEPPAMGSERIEAAVRGGWAYGSPAFIDMLQQGTRRRVSARGRGRPRRPASGEYSAPN